MNKKIGIKLRALRTGKAMSQKTIAQELGISIALYSKIETGLADISYNKIEAIADFYRITPIDILKVGESDAPPTDYAQQLKDITQQFSEQQKKMIVLYEIIRNYKEHNF